MYTTSRKLPHCLDIAHSRAHDGPPNTGVSLIPRTSELCFYAVKANDGILLNLPSLDCAAICSPLSA